MDFEQTRSSFEAGALPHLHALHGFALMLTGRPSEAEDLVQDTYVRALRFFHRYEPGTNCKAWLFTIMKHIFLNQAPQRARELLSPDEETAPTGDAVTGADGGAGPVEQSPGGRDEVFRQDVTKALALLPDAFRVVVVLREIEGFSYREIAQILSCPLGTVMSRLSRGRDLLRQLLQAYAEQSLPVHARAKQ